MLIQNSNNWKAVTPEEELVSDIGNFQNNLVAIFDDGTVREYDLSNEKWDLLLSDRNFPSRLFSDKNTDGVERCILLGVTMYCINTLGDQEWLSEETFVLEEGVINDVITRRDNILITLSPIIEREDLKEEYRRR